MSIHDHFCAPIYDALIHIQQHTSLHVPGHKMGQSFDEESLALFRSILMIDQTEIDGLDDLHHSEGIIKEAEQLAADAFGSEETKFLVGGTTAGILALILGTIQPGDRCLIQRNSHKSIINGLKLAKGEVVLLNPRIDSDFGIPLDVSAEQIEEILKNDPKIKAVFLTSPNYYGQVSDIQSIAKVVHRYSLPLLVDEAHGAHFKFHRELPSTALEQGADAVVQSTHKTLSSMTMTSMLHFQGNQIDRDRVKEWLSIVQSSSPSYPLMASLDLARRHMMVGSGKEEISNAIELIKGLRSELDGIPWLKCVPTADPLRLVLALPTGWYRRLQQHLLNNQIYVEIAEPERLVMVFSGGNQEQDFIKLNDALHSFIIPEGSYQICKSNLFYKQSWPKGKLDFSVEKSYKIREWMDLKDAPGQIVATMLISYPPGIPLFFEGERLTEEFITMIEKLVEEKIHIQGIVDGKILVYKEGI